MHTHTHAHKISMIPLDEGSARLSDLYVTTHNTHKRHTSMPPAGFEPAIPTSERPPGSAKFNSRHYVYTRK